MNREQLHLQLQAAAQRLTDEIVGTFAEMLQSIVKEITVGAMFDAPPQAPSRADQEPPPVVPAAAQEGVLPAKPEVAVAPVARRKPGRPPRSTEDRKAPAAKSPGVRRRATKSAPMAGRRSVKDIDRAAERIEALLRSTKAEMRMEEINKHLGTITRDMMRPIKNLLEAGKIQRKGERRSTTYFAV